MELETLFPRIPMERTRKTLRKSVHIFLQNFHFFTTIPALIAFPFSISILLSQFLLPFSSLLPYIQNRLFALSYAAGFPSYSQFFILLNLKLSQTITSSIIIFPFTLFFLLISKSLAIQFLKNCQKTSSTSLFSTYSPILITQLYNFFLIVAANSTCFSLLFISFNLLKDFGFSSPNSVLLLSSVGAVLYSIILANTIIISNLALISSGVEQNGGYLAILKACVLIRGRTATALALAIPANFGLAVVESLFQYRVMRAYYDTKSFNISMALEGIFIAYLYCIIIVVDTIIGYVFFKSCKVAYWLDHERRCDFRFEYEGLSISHNTENAKLFEEIP